MGYCQNCGDEIDEAATVCPACGVNQETPLEGAYEDRSADEKYCTNCGTLIAKQAELCPDCGVTQSTSSTDSEKVAASILAILVGGFGAHKFYQGNTQLGVVYLCFFWTGIPELLGLVEGILMLMADDEEYERKYADGSLLGS